MALGNPISVSLDGRKYKIVKDTEPEIVPGGVVATEMQEYGDGTADPVKTVQIGKITGLSVFVPIADEEHFKLVCAKDSMPVVLTCTTGSYEITGCIVGDDLSINTKTRKTGDFDVHCTDGSGVRSSAE